MDENEILKKFGIGKKLAYGLFIQSLLVIISVILSVFTMYLVVRNTSDLFIILTIVFQVLTCILLLIYSFFKFNSNYQEHLFQGAIVTYILFLALSLRSSYFYLNNISTFLNFAELILLVIFLFSIYKNNNLARKSIFLIIIIEIISNIYMFYLGFELPFIFIKNIVVLGSFALTYYERLERGKYPNRFGKFKHEYANDAHWKCFTVDILKPQYVTSIIFLN